MGATIARARGRNSEQLRPLIQSAGADSIGIGIPGNALEMRELPANIKAADWRKQMRLATAHDWHFFGVGRPWHAQGGGIYALARSLRELPAALALCKNRIGEHGSKATAWIVLGDDDFVNCPNGALAECAGTAGTA